MLELIGRKEKLFSDDLAKFGPLLKEILHSSRVLIIGGAGSIGRAVSAEIFKRDPKALHVVDISENNLVELVRGLRSSLGYIQGEFKTYAIDCGGCEFEALIRSEKDFDYVLNLSALKHVRSERDPFTLMRMVEVNILNTLKTISLLDPKSTKKYFNVSTDKATNPVNMMGASKRIMEMFLLRESLNCQISMARFANVAFSDGSLLHGFNQRFIRKQPLSAPRDVQRYFVTPEESGELTLLACLLGDNRDIFFPKLVDELSLVSFDKIATKFLEKRGFEAYECESEDEARRRVNELIAERRWPCFFFDSDTTGEKGFEEFYTEAEDLDMDRFKNIGVIRNSPEVDVSKLDYFLQEIHRVRSLDTWSKSSLVNAFTAILPDFNHIETGKDLDSKM